MQHARRLAQAEPVNTLEADLQRTKQQIEAMSTDVESKHDALYILHTDEFTKPTRIHTTHKVQLQAFTEAN